MALSAPTGSRVFDTFTRAILALCLMNVLYSSFILGFYPAPVSASLRIVHYLMEVDATACKQQNTHKNREAKHASL